MCKTVHELLVVWSFEKSVKLLWPTFRSAACSTSSRVPCSFVRGVRAVHSSVGKMGKNRSSSFVYVFMHTHIHKHAHTYTNTKHIKTNTKHTHTHTHIHTTNTQTQNTNTHPHTYTHKTHPHASMHTHKYAPVLRLSTHALCRRVSGSSLAIECGSKPRCYHPCNHSRGGTLS